jgi:hypothetical protein
MNEEKPPIGRIFNIRFVTFNKRILMKIYAAMFALLISASVFAVEKDPCGVAYSTGMRFTHYDRNDDGSINFRDPQVAVRIEKVLKNRKYNIVEPEEATYTLMVTEVGCGNSLTKVCEFSLDFYEGWEKRIVRKNAFIDAWPVGMPEFLVRNKIVSWAKKIPECQ